MPDARVETTGRHPETEAVDPGRVGHRSVDEYRLLVDQSVDVLFHTVDDVVTVVSPSLRDLLGLAPDGLVGSTLDHLWHPVDLPRVVQLADRVEEGAAGAIRARMRHRDGHYVDVKVAMRPVDELNGGRGAVGSITDVSDLVAAERLLEESAAEFQMLAEHAADVVFRASIEGVTEWISPSVQRVLGRRPSELIGKPFSELVHPDDVATFATVQADLTAGESRTFEMRVRKADGAYRWVSVAVRPLLDRDGVVVGRAGGWRVADAEHEARHALEEAERRFRLVLEHAPIAMCLTDPEGRFLLVNPALSQMMGHTATHLLSSTWQELTHPDDLDADLGLVTDILEGRRDSYQHRKRFIDASGQVVWGDLSVAAIRDESGAVANFVGQISDVTALVATETELERSEAHFRLIAEHSSDVVLRCSPDRSIEWASPSAGSFGWDPEDLVGRSVAELVHPPDRVSSAAARAWLFSTTGEIDPSAHFLVRLRTGTGELRWVDGTASLVGGAGSDSVAIVSGLRDVDELVGVRHRSETERQRLESILDSLADPHVILHAVRDDDGTLVDLVVQRSNRAAADALGGPEVLTPGTSLADLPLDPGWEDFAAACNAAAASHGTVRSDAVRMSPGDDPGSERRVDARATGVEDSVVLTWHDVTDRLTTEERLRRSEERLRTVVDGAPVAMALLDADQRMEAVNPSLCDLLGADPTWLLGRRLTDIEVDQPRSPQDREQEQEEEERDGQADGRLVPSAGPVEIRLRRPDGTEAWIERSIAPVAGATDGATATPSSYVAQFVDVDRARRQREDLAYAATHDSLTGLGNRRALLDRLERILDHPARRSTVLGVLAIDVDDLKSVNDELGHPAGDELLRETATRLRRALRSDDTIARTGGDEFVALLPGLEDLDTATLVAEKVLAAFTPEMELDDERRRVTVSIGATVAEPGEPAKVVLARADRALLQAKAGGRARSATAPPPHPAT